ncbi:MAG: roadblock/LC7 domain-containing protein [Promethearchaeota archaeon]
MESSRDFHKDEKVLKEILRTIVNSTAGIKYSLIIDDTGLTILSHSKFNLTNNEIISVEKIGAIGGAVFIAGEEQGEVLGYGHINMQITEYSKGMIFSVKAGKGILCIATDKNVNMGYVRAITKKYAPKIKKILENYLEDDNSKGNKIKELFDSDSVLI